MCSMQIPKIFVFTMFLFWNTKESRFVSMYHLLLKSHLKNNIYDMK